MSGFRQLYKSFEKIEKIRILVGLNIEKKKPEKIEIKAHPSSRIHAKVYISCWFLFIGGRGGKSL